MSAEKPNDTAPDPKLTAAFDVDIDPGWYPGQPELLDEATEGNEEQEDQLEQRSGASTSRGGISTAAGRANRLPPVSSVPTVLTKLQKWGDYVSVGTQVLPTKFIPMKTPLSAEILDNWSLPSQPKHRLTVPEMVAQQAALGRKVGLLLDLSNHDCLYTADIPPDVSYLHIQLVAKELPAQDFVDAVVSAANKFWRDKPDEYIAVHCAYGFNRTGFVVCCYLIEVHGLSVEDALAAFAESRPPGVKHEQFRYELHRRYGTTHTAAMYGAYGSPDENSSFGYSPSCGSLGDLGLGPSPLPLLRSSTLESMLGRSPIGSRLSLDDTGSHHQTLTFTSSSVPENCQLGSSAAQLWQQRFAGHGAPNGNAHERQAVEEPFPEPSGTEEQQSGQLPGAADGRASPPGEASDGGPSAAGHRQGSSDGSFQQSQHHQQSHNENESLGVNDRFILQTLRQRALAHANSTIPEETGSSPVQSTPGTRGCSSNSLADCGHPPTGYSTPPKGQFNRRSIETIDWAAAAADDGDPAGSVQSDAGKRPMPEVEGLTANLNLT